MIQDCETLAIDNSWSLTRKNACHIANQNEEMGALSKAQDKMVFRLSTIEWHISLNTWLWGIIAAATIGIAIKKIFNSQS